MAAAHAIGGRDAGATCRICGQPALPVLRLCAQCKAALKRVRHDTVSQQMPMPRRPRGGERSRFAARRDDVDAVRRGGARAWRGLRAPMAFAAMLAIVGSAGYFIVQQIHAAMPPEPDPAMRADAATLPVAAPNPIVASSIPAAPVLAVPSDAARAADDVAPTPTLKPKVAARAVKPAPAPPVAPAPDVAPEPAPAPVIVAAAPPPAVRPPDRMQLLSQAFAQCPSDGVLARMVCEQKARTQYCDGYWGQTSLCPNGAPDRSLSH